MEATGEIEIMSLKSLQHALPSSPHPLSQSVTAHASKPTTPQSTPLKRSTSASVLSASEEDDDDDELEDEETDDEEDRGPVQKPTKLKYTQKHQPPTEPVVPAGQKPSKPKGGQIDSESEGSEANDVDPAMTTDSDAENEELEQDGNGISFPTRRKTMRIPKSSILSDTSRSSKAPSVASSSNSYQPLTSHQHHGTPQMNAPYPYQTYPAVPGGMGGRVANPQQGTYFYPYEQIQGGVVNNGDGDGDEDDVPLAAVKATGSEGSVPSRNSVAVPENIPGYPRGGYGPPRGYVGTPPQWGREYGMNPHGYPNQYNEYGPPDGSQYSGSGPRSIGSGYRHPGFYDHDGFSPQSGYSEYSDDYSEDDYPMDPSQLPPADYRPGSASLLGGAEQARQNALNAPRYGPLIDVPRKPPPPQTGLLGAITARERAKEANKFKPFGRGTSSSNAGAELQRERAFEMERERRLQEQRQMVYFDEMARRQQMMGGGMYPPMQGYGPYYNQANVDPYRYPPLPGDPMMGTSYPGPAGHPMRPYSMMGRPGYYGTTTADDGDEDDDVVLAAIKNTGSMVPGPEGTPSSSMQRSSADWSVPMSQTGSSNTAPVQPPFSKPLVQPLATALLDPSIPLHPLSENLPHVPSSVIHAFDKFIEEKLSMKPHSRISTSVLYRAYVNWAATRPRTDRKSKDEVKDGTAEEGEETKDEKVPEEEEEEEGEYVEQGVFAELMIENGFVKKLKKGSATVEEWYNVTLVKI